MNNPFSLDIFGSRARREKADADRYYQHKRNKTEWFNSLKPHEKRNLILFWLDYIRIV